MSNLFLFNVNQNDSGKQQENASTPGAPSWSTDYSELEDFKRRYQQENATRSPGLTTSSPFSSATPNTPSPSQPKRTDSGSLDGGRYRSMVEGFMNERPSSTSTASASGGLFLPFMDNKQEPVDKNEPNIAPPPLPQMGGGLFLSQSPQQPPQGSLSSVSPQQPQQQPPSLHQAPPINFPSFDSPPHGLAPPPSGFGMPPQQQQQQPPSIHQLLNQGFNQGMMGANSEQMRQMMMVQQMMQQQGVPPHMIPQLMQQYFQQQQQGGFGSPAPQQQGPPPGMSPHLQQFASQYAAPTPAPSPQTPITGQQQQQSLEEQFMQKTNLFDTPPQQNLSPSPVDTSQVSNQSDAGEEDVKTRTRKPSISVDNQLVYLYPRHGRMEKTFTTLSNVHVRYGSFMSTPDVYFIARNHLKDLAVENPYVDDYYYLIHMTKLMKSAPHELSKWIKKNIHDRQNPPEKDPGPQFDTRLFGRIAGTTPKAPRVVVDDVEPADLPQNSRLNSSAIALQCQIEDGFDQLLIIEDYALCTAAGKSRSTLDTTEATELSDKVVNFIKSQYAEILATPKGVKFVGKALKTISVENAGHILDLLCSKWDDLNKASKLFEQEDSPLLTGMCVCVQKIANLSQLTQLLIALVHSKNVFTERMSSAFFVQLLAMVMKRAGDLRNAAEKKVLDEWNRCFTNLVFLNLKQMGFKTVVENGVSRDDVTWFFLASLLVHCQRDQRQFLLDQVKTYTQSKDAEKNPSIETFLTVVKESNKIK